MGTRFEKVKQDMQKKDNEAKEAMRREFKEFLDHPLLYVALIASGFLSALAGLAIGLGLQMVDGEMVIRTDFGHVFFAVLYFVLFPYFFEFGLANWLNKFLHREDGNNIQYWTSLLMISVTFIGTGITAYSAMDVLVTAGGFFDSFVEVPAGVQRWIAFALPTMFLLNIASGEMYRQFTKEARLTRTANKELREDQIAADMEVKLAQMKARKDIAIAEAEAYSSKAEKDALEIGRNRGNANWDNDKTQKYSIPATTFATETKLAETKEPQNPPNPPR